MGQKITTHEHENSATSVSSERIRIEKTAFSGFAHDLKTPLACIISALEIYERMDGKLTEEKRQLLVNAALQESYKLNGLISTLLDNVAPK